jgi:hypothetical protein
LAQAAHSSDFDPILMTLFRAALMMAVAALPHLHAHPKESFVRQTITRLTVAVCAISAFSAIQLRSHQFPLLAAGTLDQSRAASFADVSGLTYMLENGVPANYLGGFGSAITFAGGNTFVAPPDRGPNAVPSTVG